MRYTKKYNELASKAKISEGDIERKVLFFIVSGNMDLYNQVDKIYDFTKNELNLEKNENYETYVPNLMTSSSNKRLINLALQLYNRGTKQTVIDTFSDLDTNNFNLAISAVRLRFGM